MSVYYDGNFTVPYFQTERKTRPIEGVETFMWEETYLQQLSYFVPMTYSTASTRHPTPTFYLVDESVPEPVGTPNSTLVKFTRVYAQVPTVRTQTTLVAQPYFGKSNGGGISWNSYGTRKPFSNYATALDTFEYFQTSDPTTISINYITQPKFSGEPVDYFGTVYSTISPYSFLGFTTPLSEPTNYTAACEVERWRGQIWQRITRTVSYPLGI